MKDIWDDVRFLNTWIALATSWPDNVRVVRYEDLRSDTPGKLEEILAYFDIPLKQQDTVKWSIDQCSKENMSMREAPKTTTRVVRPDEKDPLDIYTEEDKGYFMDIYSRHLKVKIPYDLADW